MSALPAGSLGWLLAHELRLTFRQFSGLKRKRTWVGLALLAGLLLMGSYPFVMMLRQAPLAASGSFNAIAAAAALFTFSLLVSQTLSMTVLVFFDRGDLDLLLSSPIAPRKVLMVRCLAIAAAPMLLYVALVSPYLIPAVLFADARLLAVYGVLVALMLLGAAAGMAAAIGLFLTLGPRRTKVVGQVLAAAVGAIVFLAIQAPNFAPQSGPALKAAFVGWVRSGAFSTPSPLSWFGRAALAEPLPLIGLLAFSGLFFYAAAALAGPFCARVAASAAGTATPRPARAVRRARFSARPQTALIRKEWLLIARDPALISQVLLRVLYFVPLALVLMRANFTPGADMLVIGGCGSIVLFSSQIAGSLAWIAISAEDAADLIACAPIPAPAVRRAKLTAALSPVAVLAFVPLVLLLVFHPWAGLMAALFAFLACYAVVYVNLWYETPQKRSQFRRRGQGSIIANLGEAVLGFAFVPVTVLAALGTFWAAPFALLPIAVLGGLYLGRKQDA